jgi:hypothetical protein
MYKAGTVVSRLHGTNDIKEDLSFTAEQRVPQPHSSLMDLLATDTNTLYDSCSCCSKQVVQAAAAACSSILR